jgi:hypothetical protein
MDQKEEDRIAMIGFFIFNLVLVFLAKQVADSVKDCDKSVLDASTWLLTLCSTSLGASAVCIFMDCAGRKLTMGLISVVILVTLIFAATIHSKCKDAHKYTTPLIVVDVLLLVAAIGLSLRKAQKAGLINIGGAAPAAAQQHEIVINI